MISKFLYISALLAGTVFFIGPVQANSFKSNAETLAQAAQPGGTTEKSTFAKSKYLAQAKQKLDDYEMRLVMLKKRSDSAQGISKVKDKAQADALEVKLEAAKKKYK